MDLTFLYAVGVVLVAVGVAIIVAAVILASRCNRKETGKVHSAGVIMIGPIPIVFGTDKKSVKTVLTLALALTILALIVILLNYWLLR